MKRLAASASVMLLAGSALAAPPASGPAGAPPAHAPAHALAPSPANAAPRARATRKLSVAELDRAARDAIAASAPRLPKDATLKSVRASVVTELVFSPERVTIDVTAPPRRAGTVTTTAVLSFWKDASTVGARAPVILELEIPQASLVFDVSKGAPLTLAIERGLVVVTTTAVAAADANIGDVIQVLLRPSGRALRARVVAKDRAVATEEMR